MTTSTNEFQQVTTFSLFHCAANAPQTKIRWAFSVILTQSNKTETVYQVMRHIAKNRCTYPPIPPLTGSQTKGLCFILLTQAEIHVIFGENVDFLVGWVELAESHVLAANSLILPDYVWIAEHLNPTPNSALSRYRG